MGCNDSRGARASRETFSTSKEIRGQRVTLRRYGSATPDAPDGTLRLEPVNMRLGTNDPTTMTSAANPRPQAMCQRSATAAEQATSNE